VTAAINNGSNAGKSAVPAASRAVSCQDIDLVRTLSGLGNIVVLQRFPMPDYIDVHGASPLNDSLLKDRPRSVFPPTTPTSVPSFAADGKELDLMARREEDSFIERRLFTVIRNIARTVIIFAVYDPCSVLTEGDDDEEVSLLQRGNSRRRDKV
jgi:hypothetical protein